MDVFQRAAQNVDAAEVVSKIETIQEAAKVISSKAKVLADIYAKWAEAQTAGTYPHSDIQKLAQRLDVKKLKALVTAANDYLL